METRTTNEVLETAVEAILALDSRGLHNSRAVEQLYNLALRQGRQISELQVRARRLERRLAAQGAAMDLLAMRPFPQGSGPEKAT